MEAVTDVKSPVEKLKTSLRKLADIRNTIAVLHWDQEIFLPPKGGTFRASQIATLSGIAHEMFTSDEMGELLQELQNLPDLSFKDRRNFEETYRDFEKSTKLPKEFVEEMARTTSESLRSWIQAKNDNNFEIFRPLLEKVINLKIEESNMKGYDEHPYDALLDDYEAGSKVSDLDKVFNQVRDQLPKLLQKIKEQPQVKDDFMYRHFPKDKQWDLGVELLKQMGYDFDAGRQDISTHPFTTTFAPTDVRVTTRISENNLNEMIWSTIHEGGHALYEQGLPESEYGLPSGEYISLGIHESQSRLWENNVGRSRGYWKANFSRLKTVFHEALSNVSAEDFYKAMNKVEPSLIRTSADELTYHFHILIRYEIEKALISKQLPVKDVREMWNENYRKFLGIDVPTDVQGILQDVHWSHGSFGYFPTYSMGSFYAAQFFNQAKKDLPDLDGQIEQGNLQPLQDWLREKIHKHGKLYRAQELCERVTGEKLNFSYFMEYAGWKYGGIYGF